MKKLFAAVLVVFFISVHAQQYDQYCGHSGTLVCTPTNLTQPGFSPIADSFPAILIYRPCSQILQFKNFDSLQINGRQIAIHSLKFDTINNLPRGLCWETNDTANTWAPLQTGSILIMGTTTAFPGQYKLHIIVDIDTGGVVTMNADSIGLRYYVRAFCDSSTIKPIDTTQTEANPFIPYSYVECDGGIIEPDFAIRNVSISPNPFSNQASVAFTSTRAGTFTEKLTTILGDIVYSKAIEVNTGSNAFIINRNKLTAGIHLYTISDGQSTLTKKLVITD